MSVVSAYTEVTEAIQSLAARETGIAEVSVDNLTGRIGGASRDLFVFDLTLGSGSDRREEHCVLLRNHEQGCLDTSRRHEFEILSALVGRQVPAPVPLWVDDDGSVLGQPGIVLRHVPGDNDRRRLADYPPQAQATVEQSFVKSLASLHAQTFGEDELLFLPRTAAEDVADAQLDVWEEAYREAAPDGSPGMTLVLGWLRANTPTATRTSLIHGDFRYGNVLFDESGLTAIVDWELAHFGDPAEDLVWPFRAFRRNTAPPGGWKKFRDDYERHSGTEIPTANWQFYRVLSAFETGVMCLAARAGFVSGGSDDLVNAHMGLNVGFHTEQALRWIDEIEKGREE